MKTEEAEKTEKSCLNPFISNITLDINVLNTPNKRLRLWDWIKQNILFNKIHVKYKDVDNLNIEGLKKMYQANNQNKAGVAI